VNPDVLGLLAQKERLRIEALAREEALWGGDGTDPETGEPLPQLELDGPTDVPTAEADPASVSDASATPENLDPAALESEIVALLEGDDPAQPTEAGSSPNGEIEPAPIQSIDYEALFDAALSQEHPIEDDAVPGPTEFDIDAIENETPAADLDAEAEASNEPVDPATDSDDSRFQIGIDSQANPDSSIMDESDFDDDEDSEPK
jgi:hypothetical protein